MLSDARYANTEMGNLLRSASPFSDLTRIYGGRFYDAWSEFGATMRSGATAFSHRFGAEHFDHFARHPGDARMFDRGCRRWRRSWPTRWRGRTRSLRARR